MKMVASAKLRKAQIQNDRFLPYQRKLNEIQTSFLSASPDFETPLAEKREVKRVAIVALASNSSLCGAFNSNVMKLLKEKLNKYKHLSPQNIEIYAVGKKLEDNIRKTAPQYKLKGGYIHLMDKPYFGGAKEIADALIQDFSERRIDKVELVYNHYKNAAIQIPVNELYLPIQLNTETSKNTTIQIDYIVEPDKETILQSLIPKSLHSKIYAILLDSAAAEQAARVMAMQIATDNAKEILDELTIQYNKQRQQAITSELLDIVGGWVAQK